MADNLGRHRIVTTAPSFKSSCRSRQRVSALVLNQFSNVRYWHFASFTATQHFGRYWSNRRTLFDTGADWLGRE